MTRPKANMHTPGAAKVPSIDPKDFLERTEAKIEELSRTLVQASGEARVQAHLALMELADNWQAAQSEMNKQVSQLRRGTTKVRAVLDDAKVQAHLAKADASDRVREMRSRLASIEQKLKGFVSRQESQASVAIARLEKACREFGQKLKEE